MSLTTGTRLGPYEILAPIGAGGMGEVYRARDTRLERTVAVKVLPARLSASPESRQRFEREAKTISQLSHPHICALHDVGREGETEYLVMELLEGETLSDRLAKGALPIDRTLRYGRQIADALDKAHRQGIVHRDLKPGNVMITKTGVKLLDFGLAKGMAAPAPPSSVTSLPTQQGLTQEGTILGTFQYMAPEQLEGKEADARTDIFAFGATLYEMATGKKAFAASSQASLISAIMTSEPSPISSVSSMAPPALDRVVRKCLAKDPEDRWQSAADLASELDWVGETGSRTAAGAPDRSRRRAWLPWAVAAVATLAALGLAFRGRRAAVVADAGRIQLSILPPVKTVLTDFFDLSPNGRMLAFVAVSGGKELIRVRDLGSEDVRSLPGTESAESVFWSPDSRALGFVARGKLRRIDLATGAIEPLADAAAGRGGSWGPGGDIVFAAKSAGAIYRVPASGGAAEPVTKLEEGDLLHRWPQFLPDGRRFLFFDKTDKPETTGIYLASVGDAGRKLVLRNGAMGLFVPPRTLLFVRGEVLLAQAFDPTTGEVGGEPRTIARPVPRGDLGSYRDLFCVSSSSGIIVFRPGSAERRLFWFDRRGTVLKAVGPTADILTVRLSPDGGKAGFTTRSAETGNFISSVLDLDLDAAAQFVEPGYSPVWTPDGAAVIYRSDGHNYEIRRKAVRGDAEEAKILADAFVTPHDVSPDGRYLLYTRMGANFDIGVKDLKSDAQPPILLASPFDERSPHFSPDGRYFVYSSDEPGQSEVFVRRFPMTDEKWQVSSGGGQQPLWSHDGKEIFFIDLAGRLSAARVEAGASFSAAPAQALFQTSLRLNSVAIQFAASHDGQRLLVVRPTQEFDSQVFRVLMNWTGVP